MNIKTVDQPLPVSKLALLTEKDALEYDRIKDGLVKVLEKLGGYEPAVDDIHVDMIARALIYAKKSEAYLDSETTSADYYVIVADIKLKLAKIIDNAIQALAVSRRDRIGKQTEASLKREMKEAFLKVMKLREQ